MGRIIRVFPRKTSFSPTDPMVFFGPPGMFVPEHDAVHVSVAFTWDIARGEWLKMQWESATKKRVMIGGPAFGDPGMSFVAGRYVRPGITFTSRGCPNKCPWCSVHRREGGLRELPIVPGNTLQDNNLLACSRGHLDRVFSMLSDQFMIRLSGGLESSRINTNVADRLRGLRIRELWLSCDSGAFLKPAGRAIGILRKAGFRPRQIRVYVLVGKNRDEEEERLRDIFGMGAFPFAQLYRSEDGSESYGPEWKSFMRTWSRPAAYVTKMKEGC